MAKKRSVAPLVLAGLLGVALIVGVKLFLGGSPDAGGTTGPVAAGTTGQPTSAPAPNLDGCATLNVVASSEKAALLTQLAEQYNSTPAKDGNQCTSVTVSSKASGLAQEAATQSLDGLASNDEVGLWVFSTELGPNLEPWVQLQAVGSASTTVPKMKADIKSVTAGGGTGLYATLRAAHAQMLADLSSERSNALVVLSDGQNEDPKDNNLGSLISQLNGESADTSVRVFTIGYGEDADPETLTEIANAARGKYYEASDPASIQRVLTSVLSNF